MSEHLFDLGALAGPGRGRGACATESVSPQSAAAGAPRATMDFGVASGQGPSREASAPHTTRRHLPTSPVNGEGLSREANVPHTTVGDNSDTATAGPGGPTGPSGPTFPVSPIPAVNVAMVPQRSPLRYPGGKTWLIPHVRAWLEPMQPRPTLLVEPFCGGAIVSLTAAFEGLAERCLMSELDHDVAAFWHAALRHGAQLRELVAGFELTRGAVSHLAETAPDDVVAHGFRTLVLNRTRRGGILAAGAALARSGENNRGVASRWYRDTLLTRLRDIEARAERITFCEGDGLALLGAVADVPGAVAFVDPPYTAGGKRAGKRLYAHHALDHRAVFKTLAESAIDFLMTYDQAPQIVDLVHEFGFCAVEVVMKNTHHARVSELVISRRPIFTQKPFKGPRCDAGERSLTTG